MSEGRFDVTDERHRADPYRPPDKAPTWRTHPHADRWVLCHDAIRGELDAMSGALSAVAERGGGGEEGRLPEWTVRSIRDWWGWHERHVREHCSKEEEILVPFVSKRFHWPRELKEDHDAMDRNDWHGKIDALVEDLSDLAGVAELRDAWEEYREKLSSHLRREEETAFLLTRAYFTQSEVSPVGRKIMESEPDMTVGAMIHFMGEERFRREFMKDEGIPFFVWHAAFRGRHAAYRDKVSCLIDALVAGREPENAGKKSRWGIF